MLAEQFADDRGSIHDGEAAAKLNLAGAPIEDRPTSASSIRWPCCCGAAWFEHGCISSHFRTMVVEGERVQASLTTTGANEAAAEAHKEDGTPVLTGTASVGPDHAESELDRRVAKHAASDPGDLFIIDQLEVGMRDSRDTIAYTHPRRTQRRGLPVLPRREARTDHRAPPVVHASGRQTSPWGRAIVPIEMVSVLVYKQGPGWPVRGPALGCSSTSRSGSSTDRCSSTRPIRCRVNSWP